MGRHKSAKNVPIVAWLSAKADCREGRFIQVGNSLLLSGAFHKLNPKTQMLYLALAMESGGKQSVKLSHGSAKSKYGISPTTYDRAIKQLIAEGYITQVIDEDRSQYATNQFRFANNWKENSRNGD